MNLLSVRLSAGQLERTKYSFTVRLKFFLEYLQVILIDKLSHMTADHFFP